MTTRRQLIQSIPALPLLTAASATALLAACGDKKVAEVPAQAPAPAPVAAAPAAPATPPPPTSPAPAAAAAVGQLLDEKEPQAVALGYFNDATKTDKVKYAKYADGQNCANCALYLGGAAAQGGCPLFPGKQVAAKAWCSAWAKKAA